MESANIYVTSFFHSQMKQSIKVDSIRLFNVVENTVALYFFKKKNTELTLITGPIKIKSKLNRIWIKKYIKYYKFCCSYKNLKTLYTTICLCHTF